MNDITPLQLRFAMAMEDLSLTPQESTLHYLMQFAAQEHPKSEQ